MKADLAPSWLVLVWGGEQLSLSSQTPGTYHHLKLGNLVGVELKNLKEMEEDGANQDLRRKVFKFYS